jgi:prepilin-type processing-associated H-X9-DG protein
MSHIRATYDGNNHSHVQPPGTRIRDITDGTSNTIAVYELSGRNALYRLRVQVTPPGQLVAGMWMDLLHGNPASQVRGTLYDGVPLAGAQRGGPCGVNCANTSEAGLYSWHEGGAQAVMADGSVRFISENVDSGNLALAMLIGDNRVLGEW